MRTLQKWLYLLIPFAMLAVALAVPVLQPRLVEFFQNQVFDAYQRLSPRPYEDTAVRIIDIDNESLEKLGQWPWPRTYFQALLYHAFTKGAGVVSFDIVFDAPDRTSPKQVSTYWPQTDALKEIEDVIAALPDHDKEFADIMAQTNVVVGMAMTNDLEGNLPKPKWGFAITGGAGQDPLGFLTNYKGAIRNIPEIEEAAAGLGSFNLDTKDEVDNVIRRAPMFFRSGKEIFPSLAAETLRVAQGASTYILKAAGAYDEKSFGAETGFNHVKIGRFEIPVDPYTRFWLHYAPSTPKRVIPAWKVITGNVTPEELEGRILLVGTSAEGLKDLRATPLNPFTPGVEVHANILEQILLGSYLQRPDWAPAVERLFLIVIGVIVILLIRRLGALACAMIAATAIAIAVTASWLAYSELRFLFDPVGPSSAVFAIYLAGSLINYVQTESERKQVRSAFSQYLSPALVEQLADNPDKLTLGGETREMTFLFCDIRGFTPISEQYKDDPQGLTVLINRFLTPMTDIIMANKGTIDKYMGDCIMAFWNAPLDDPEHYLNAARAAMLMQSELNELNAALRREAEAEGRPFLPINIGIGINTGECVVGNMGSRQRFDYSVLGDAVNLASRLEGQSKTYGVTVVLGEGTAVHLDEYATLELDLIAVKGKSEAVRIYTLLGGEEIASTPAYQRLRESMQKMLAAYRSQNWRRARDLLEECRTQAPDLQILWDLYNQRLDHFTAAPPPADWDGVFRATTK